MTRLPNRSAQARRLPAVAGLLVISSGLTLAGCGREAPTAAIRSPLEADVTPAAPAAVGPSSASSPDPELLDAIQTRRLYGLRTDEEWVRGVNADPAAQAGVELFGIPLTMAERADIKSRRWDEDLLDKARTYCSSVPGECAGTYINLQGSGVIMDLAHNVERHTAILRNLVPDRRLLQIQVVNWSLAELNAFVRQVESERAWFDTIGVRLMQVDRRITEDFIHADFESRTDAEGAIIEAHFGDPSWLKAEWVGPPRWAGKIGDLDIQVLNAAGDAAVGIRCDIRAVNAKSGVDLGEVAYSTDESGTCRARNIPAVPYRVTLYRWVNDHQERVDTDEILTSVSPQGGRITVVLPDE